jgi:predicted Fe-Mo cluster-binding NifX family protein
MLYTPVNMGDSMQVAIAVWNDRISPVFDTSNRLLLVDVEHGAERGPRIVVEIGGDSFPTQRARRLTELEVNVLICGAISRPLAEMVSASGVVVIPWVSGPVEAVLRAYLTKRLSDSRWRMPGCRGRWRHRYSPTGPQDHGQT